MERRRFVVAAAISSGSGNTEHPMQAKVTTHFCIGPESALANRAANAAEGQCSDYEHANRGSTGRVRCRAAQLGRSPVSRSVRCCLCTGIILFLLKMNHR